LPVDAFVARTLLEALAPDRIAIAVAAVGQLQEEARQLDKQWGLRRERARYEAERARRQYDAVEPENRLGRVCKAQSQSRLMPMVSMAR
jgi:hypothetical protein